jgi:hypothetical protein
VELVAFFFSTLQMETKCSSNLDFIIALSSRASSRDYLKQTNKQKTTTTTNNEGTMLPGLSKTINDSRRRRRRRRHRHRHHYYCTNNSTRFFKVGKEKSLV